MVEGKSNLAICFSASLFFAEIIPAHCDFLSALAIYSWINYCVHLLTHQTATSALWLLYNLARHPGVQEKLYQEVTGVIGKDGDVSPGGLAKLSYLKACVKESARRVLC